jgi:hypothetical protein
MNQNENLPALFQKAAVEVLPDSDRYKCRIKVRSESSNSIYMVSYDAAPGAGYWTCSCRGNLSTGMCKHLRALGVTGRKFGKVPLMIKRSN